MLGKRRSQLFAFLSLWTIGALGTSVALARATTESQVTAHAIYVAAPHAFSLDTHALAIGRGSRAVVVFTDFLCPSCRTLARMEDSLAVTDSSLRFVDVAAPRWNTNGYMASLAAECGRDQVEPMRVRATLLSVDTMLIARRDWQQLGQALHVADQARFAACLASVQHADVVEQAISRGRRLGVRGTPAVLLGDSLFVVVAADSLSGLLAKTRESRLSGR